jgi:hypothetical protein
MMPDVDHVPVDELLRRVSDALNARNRKIAELETEIERLVKARERADEDAATEVKVLRATLQQSEQSRMASAAQHGRMNQLVDDALRSLNNNDRHGAEACLREALWPSEGKTAS